jgi:hypothetical protein
MTEAYFLVALALVGAAFWNRMDWCVATLAAGLLASFVLWQAQVWPPMPAIATIDGLTCVVMLLLWSKYQSTRARLVGFIGIPKGIATVAAWSAISADPGSFSLAYAVFINVAFLVQVLIAGGFTDAIGRWLDDRLTSLSPVRWRLLRDGG